MVEPPPSPESHESQDPDGFQLPGRWTLARLILPAGLLDGLTAAAAFMAQTRGQAEIAGVTALVAAMTLSEAAGLWTGARVWRNDGRLHLLLLACGAEIFAASLIVPAGAAPAAVALAFLPGLIVPLRAVALQRAVGDGVRARIASFASACDMACSTIGLLAAGALSARRKH